MQTRTICEWVGMTTYVANLLIKVQPNRFLALFYVRCKTNWFLSSRLVQTCTHLCCCRTCLMTFPNHTLANNHTTSFNVQVKTPTTNKRTVWPYIMFSTILCHLLSNYCLVPYHVFLPSCVICHTVNHWGNHCVVPCHVSCHLVLFAIEIWQLLLGPISCLFTI